MTALPAIPASLTTLMAEIGPRWGRPGSPPVAEYVNLMAREFSTVLAGFPMDGIVETRDIAYGTDDPRQVLDVHAPDGARGAPVAIFVHGGAFTDGEKCRTPQIYANVARYLARNGIVGINMEYRQAPTWKYPAGSTDCGLAVGWARANAARFGGDPRRIFLIGQSAGAAHTGSYAYDKRLHPGQGHGLAGHIVISGRVRADNLPANPNAKKVEAYYGANAARYEDVSCVNHASADSVPTFIAICEYENPMLDVYCAELYWKLARARGRADRFLRIPGHNHTSMIAHIGTADERLGRELVEFIQLGH